MPCLRQGKAMAVPDPSALLGVCGSGSHFGRAFDLASRLLAGSTDCITEHCVEVGRVKRAGQAAFLARQQRKYEGLLPAADARLQQCLSSMTQHEPHQQVAFILRLREALQAHARGEVPMLLRCISTNAVK